MHAHRADDERPAVRNQRGGVPPAAWRPRSRHEIERVLRKGAGVRSPLRTSCAEKTQRQTHLSRSVEEVVLQVSHDRFVAVFEQARFRALASPGKVSLQGTGAAVCYRDLVCVVRPYFCRSELALLLILASVY